MRLPLLEPNVSQGRSAAPGTLTHDGSIPARCIEARGELTHTPHRPEQYVRAFEHADANVPPPMACTNACIGPFSSGLARRMTISRASDPE
ncbi:MAG TPA: hypothetical protein VKX25_22135 [Bryobacteraceae bacterium]|nr:hypothetical protein [Bryobacteraceae bacterium]